MKRREWNTEAIDKLQQVVEATFGKVKDTLRYKDTFNLFICAERKRIEKEEQEKETADKEQTKQALKEQQKQWKGNHAEAKATVSVSQAAAAAANAAELRITTVPTVMSSVPILKMKRPKMIEDMDELKIFLGGEVLQSNPYFIPKKLQDCIAEPSVQTAMSLYKAHLPHMPQAEISGQGAMHFASERRSRISELLK